MSVRQAMERVIERSAVQPALKTLELDEVSLFEGVAVPLAPIFGQMADAVTTQIALNRGLVESNPLARTITGNVPVWYAVKFGVGVFAAYTVKRLQNSGHTNRARIVSAIGTLAGAGPALHNLRVMGKL